MRKTLISATAIATIAVTGLAFAQERESGQERKPAADQMEGGQSSKPAVGKEGAGAQAQGQTSEERNRRGGKAAANPQESDSAAGKRQGEAPHARKDQASQAGKREGESQAQTERGAGAREPGKAAEGQSKMQGAEERKGHQRAGETNKMERGQATQTESGKMQGKAAEGAGASPRRREGAAGEASTSPSREGATHEGKAPSAAGTRGEATVEASGNAHLSEEQASRISNTLRTTAAPAQASVNIDVNLGESVPGNLELMPLPSSIVSIVPEYRGYDYVVVHDEIVIVQPSTRKVVEVIRGGRQTHAMREGSGHGHRLTLSQSEQRLIRDTVTRERLPEAQVQEQFSYGVSVPQDVTLEPVPQPLVAQIPAIEQYQMFITDNDRIVLVDPDTREVVDVIE